MNVEQIDEIVDLIVQQLGDIKMDAIDGNEKVDSHDEGVKEIELDTRSKGTMTTGLDETALEELCERTPARIGIGKAGPRLKTQSWLLLRADHAASKDAVVKEVKDEILEELNLPCFQTLCTDKDEYLTRPDLGAQFDEETIQEIEKLNDSQPEVLIYLSDGLSSTAIEANAKDIFPALLEGLKDYRIHTGIPFFVKYGRVPAMDAIAEKTGAKVTCVLIGERPGLATAESMSAYIAYQATVGMAEARRTVVSNIHKGGIPAVEAGAHIADLIKLMLEKKASGVDLQL